MMLRTCLCVLSLALTAVNAYAVQPAKIGEREPTRPARKANELWFDNESTAIDGKYDRLQLIVSQKLPSGEVVDATRQVAYQATPTGVIDIDSQGRVTPLKNGTASVRAIGDAGEAELSLEVRAGATDVPGFGSHIMPLLSKHACNTCHGKPGGQNGFQISLFGFDPDADHRSIVLGGRGRRISPAVPSHSLILQKATATIPHGGGERFHRDTLAYQTWHHWIESGGPRATTWPSELASIEVTPGQRRLAAGQQQQLAVTARYADGTTRDVTHLAQFQPDATMLAEVSDSGLVSTDQRSGQFAIVAKFGGRVDTFRGTLPFGSEDGLQLPEPDNFIDRAVFQQWERLGLEPAERCDDRTFLRRVTIDLAGRLPTLDELDAFLQSTQANKREVVIDRLLESEDYADYFANKWLHLLRNRRIFSQQRRSTYSFHHWIRESLRTNQPYDEFVREIVAASGDMSQHPPATWYRDMLEPTAQVENMSQLFLGVRITCAKCHHHPFEKWSQKDYYSLAAFFSRVDRKESINGLFRDYERRIYHKRGVAQMKHPTTGEMLKPAVLGGEPLELDADTDPRHLLVDWMSDPDNPYFATVLVNRYWKHFFGRGIVDPEDDLRDSNPPINPELLESLRRSFIESGFDRKALVRAICLSQTYQRAAAGGQDNLEDRQNFSRYYPQRLNAEVLHDAIDQLLGTQTRFAGLPERIRAVELPDSGSDNEFLELFGKPKAETSCECERSQDGDLRQSLLLLTSNDLINKLADASARPSQHAKNTDDKANIFDLYRRAYGRPPSDQELQAALGHIEQSDDRAEAYRNLCWVIVNTKEFMYNH